MTARAEVPNVKDAAANGATAEPTALVATGKISHAPVSTATLRPVAAIADIIKMQEEIRGACTALLVDGRDYGVIPGVRKPSLWKSGAERLARAFNLAPTYRILTADIDHDRVNDYVDKNGKTRQSFGLYRFVVECSLVTGAGETVGSAVGICSTIEKKYVHAPRDSENTAVQMAQKRAYVAALRQTLGISDQFTQDVEDNPEAFRGREGAEASPPAEKPAIDIARDPDGVALFPFKPRQGIALNVVEHGAYVIDVKLLRSAFDWSKKKAKEKEEAQDADGATKMHLMANALEAELTRRMPAEPAPAAAPAAPAPVAEKKPLEDFKKKLEETGDDDLPF